MELWQQAWTPGVRCKDGGDKQSSILLPGKMLSARAVAVLCGPGEETFLRRCLCTLLALLLGVSLQEFQEQVSNFSLLLACLSWDVRATTIKNVGV